MGSLEINMEEVFCFFKSSFVCSKAYEFEHAQCDYSEDDYLSLKADTFMQNIIFLNDNRS